VFSLFPVPNFDYKREIYKDYPAPIFRRASTVNSPRTRLLTGIGRTKAELPKRMEQAEPR
jgi:hypothetical protein